MDGTDGGDRFPYPDQERRAHPRYPVDEECQLLFVNHSMPAKARLLDLSIEGCRIRASEFFPAKAGRTAEICFKVKGFAFRFCGVVRWSDGHQIAGIHFENMIPRRKAELMEVLDEIAANLAVRQKTVHQITEERHIPPPILPEPVPARSETAKPAVPAAIEKAPEPVAQIRTEETVAPAKAESAAPGPTKGRDRRGQARHEIDTTATIFLVKVASALPGRIVDLSLGGCRIHTDEKFPVGIYTRVEVEFHLQGLPFRLGGVIQAIHNRNTVGIRLLDMSERKRQQVLDLIDEIEAIRAETEHKDELPSRDQSATQSR